MNAQLTRYGRSFAWLLARVYERWRGVVNSIEAHNPCHNPDYGPFPKRVFVCIYQCDDSILWLRDPMTLASITKLYINVYYVRWGRIQWIWTLLLRAFRTSKDTEHDPWILCIRCGEYHVKFNRSDILDLRQNLLSKFCLSKILINK